MKFALSVVMIQVLLFAAAPMMANAGLLRLTSLRSNVFGSPPILDQASTATFAQVGTLREENFQPQMEGDVAVWDESTKLDVGTEVAIASVWIIMVMSLPLWIRYLSGEPFTKTQWLVAGSMWIAIFGGMYMFTNIVLFQSGHFKQVRTLSIVECIYLMSQVITTVGYGDITPAHPRGQVFVGMYVLMSIFVIAMIVSDMVALVMNTVQRYQEKLFNKEHVDVNYNLKGKADAEHQMHHSAGQLGINVKVEKPSLSPLVYSFSVYAAFACTWILFFHYFPGEGKTWMEAIYMSVITLSTVGFGVFTPNTTWGMVFASFWMIFGSAALVSVVTAFADYTLKMQEYERFDPDSTKKALEEFKEKHKHSEMTETQFIRFTLMQRGVATEAEVNSILSNFHILAQEDSDGKKAVSVDRFEADEA